jgi:uncharacterized protein YeaO (DUF488 family)
MKTMLKTGVAALSLCAMVGQSWAAGVCTRAEDAMALKTAALQQELMVAALYCNDVAPYNRFVTSYQHELQDSDATLMRYFTHGHGGASAYHAYKTNLANDFSLSGLHGMQSFCTAANAAFDAAFGTAERSLASFISTQSVAGTEGIRSCDRTVAGGEMVAGGSSRIAANREK